MKRVRAPQPNSGVKLGKPMTRRQTSSLEAHHCADELIQQLSKEQEHAQGLKLVALGFISHLFQ